MSEKEFEKFWNEPYPETGTSYNDIYGQSGMARMVWKAARKQALEELSATARTYGLTLVLTAQGMHLMKLGQIKAQDTSNDPPFQF